MNLDALLTRPGRTQADTGRAHATRAHRVRIAAMTALAVSNGWLAVIALRATDSTGVNWSISGRTAVWSPPAVQLPHLVVAVLAGAGFLLAVGSLVRRRMLATNRWVLTCLVLAAAAALLTAGSGQSVSLLALADDSFARAAPLVLAALGGIMCERAGVINVAIEGQLLIGAFAGALIGSASGSSLIGVVAGLCAGVVVGAVFASLSIRFHADQLVTGIVLNSAVAGITGFVVSGIFIDNPDLNKPPTIGTIDIPGLSQIPVVGPLLFHTSPFIWLSAIVAALVIFVLEHTRIGRHIRAVGENPKAADAAGINVERVRFWSVIAGSVIIGIAGSYFTVGSVGQFSLDMTGGRGFIALAAVILGAWRPAGAIAAAALFGAADAFQSTLSILGVPIPSPLLLCLPYLVTIVAIVVRGQVRAPAADGVPYDRA